MYMKNSWTSCCEETSGHLEVSGEYSIVGSV